MRDELGLTGTKFGCGEGLCGACTVHLGGVAVRSCSVTVADAAGKTIVTIEGLDPDGQSSGAARLARDERAAMRLLPCRADHAGRSAAGGDTRSRPTQDILTAMSGNICRCGCYQRIAAAVRLASTGV